MSRIESYEDARREFDRLSFRWPGLVLELLPPRWSGGGDPADIGLLRIIMDVEDSRGSGRTISVGQATLVPLYMECERFPHWLRSQIIELIIHEVDENLRQDGILIFDPHKS